MEIMEQAPAKLNLSLETPYRHLDGMEEWQLIMISVDLVDHVVLTPLHHDTIEVVTDKGFLPQDYRNLAYQAALLLKTRYQIAQGVRIEIYKKIPVAAGLGGGSADAAAVLRGLNRLWQLNLSLADLARLALVIDADVPFCVYSRPARVSGKGDRIELLEVDPHFWAVIAKPDVQVSTRRLLQKIDYTALVPKSRADLIVSGLKHHDLVEMAQGMGNALECVTSERYPQILQLKQKMLQAGAVAAQMSGTGPAVFGVTEKKSRAQRIVNSTRGFCREVFLVHPISLPSDFC